MINLIGKFISSVNYLINSVDRKTATNIKHTFYLLVFILLIVAVVSGYRLGKENAKIKSRPLLDITNDIFNIDIKKEKEDGDFTNMLESEIINETSQSDLRKEEFPTQDRLEPNLDKGIIDATRDKKIKTSPELDNRNQLIDDDYNSIDSKKSEVRSLDEIDKKNEIRGIPGDSKRKSKSKKSYVKDDFDSKYKINPLDTTKEKELSPIKKDEGLLENWKK